MHDDPLRLLGKISHSVVVQPCIKPIGDNGSLKAEVCKRNAPSTGRFCLDPSRALDFDTLQLLCNSISQILPLADSAPMLRLTIVDTKRLAATEEVESYEGAIAPPFPFFVLTKDRPFQLAE